MATDLITDIVDVIIEQLADIAGVKSVDTWQGEIDEMIKMTKGLPALYVIYQGADWEPYDQAGDRPSMAPAFMVVVIAQHLKGRAEGAASCNAIMDSVRNQLINCQVADYDFLRPVSEDLILAAGGILAYGMVYRMSNVLWEPAAS